MKELERVIEIIKREGAGGVKYVKWGFSPATNSYHLKIYLLKPIDIKVLTDVVKELEKSYQVKIYAPHARAIRLDLRKRF